MSNGINIDWESYFDLNHLIMNEIRIETSFRVARHSKKEIENVIYDAAKIYNDQDFIGDNSIDLLNLKNPVNIKFEKGKGNNLNQIPT